MTDDELSLVLSQIFRRLNDLEQRMEARDEPPTVPDTPAAKRASGSMRAVSLEGHADRVAEILKEGKK